MAKIFLDDARPFPGQTMGYSCVRDYNECIVLLDLFRDCIEFISLDYDLQSDFTGLDVLIYMRRQALLPQHINIHSNHETGSKEMYEYAIKCFPTSKITTNKIAIK